MIWLPPCGLARGGDGRGLRPSETRDCVMVLLLCVFLFCLFDIMITLKV